MISVEKVSSVLKLEKLIDVLIEIDNEQNREGTIIFVNENRTADCLAAFISEAICPATSVHGDSLGWQVTEALQQFESGDMPILIGTSVDRNVRCAHIINFDVPIREEEYAERIVRTDHIGNKPNVITFFEDASFGTMGQVFNFMVEAANT